MKQTDISLREFNTVCIDQVAATILSLLNIPLAEGMNKPQEKVLSKAEEVFNHSKCDRVFMYNPDAIANWIFNKYKNKYFDEILPFVDLVQPMLSVFPPKTPVCFASMYTGFQPKIHGINSYTKPVLKCNTVFDSLIKAGKKCAIVSTKNDSISLIFLERQMDYFIYKTVKECNDKAAELIKEDNYDVIILYNTDYDYWMHRNSPTGLISKKALKQDIKEFYKLNKLIKEEWSSKHKTALAFAPDHGCHRWLGLLGNHGDNEPYDMNTIHFWSFLQ